MMPDLPMPVRMTRPRQSCSSVTALVEALVEAADERAGSASASVCEDPAGQREVHGPESVRRTASGSCRPDVARAADVDREQPRQRAARAGRGAARSAASLLARPGLRGPRGRRRRRRPRRPPSQRRDVLGQAGGDAVARARQLQAVGDVEDHRARRARASSGSRACRRPGCCSRRSCRAR